MNYDEMSVQELEDELLKLKLEKLAITEKSRELQALRRDKLDVIYLTQKLGIAADGLSVGQVRALLEISRIAGRPGDVIVAPASGSVAAETIPAGVQ